MKASGTTRTGRREAFTITELLVVIAIVALVAAIAVPAFSSILYSSERSLAENQLRAGISAGRDAAIQSDGGDGAAVFFFEGGRITIVPCVAANVTLDDHYFASGSEGGVASVQREVFVPVPNVEPIQLPRGWGVRGFAPAGSVNSAADDNGWYENLTNLSDEGNWVFPETSFYDPQVGDDGWKRQTFMVRFKAGIGSLDTGSRGTALVVNAVPTAAFRQTAPWSTARIDRAQNTAQFVKRLLAQPEYQVPINEKRQIIGDEAIDTVLVRPVTELALYDEKRLVAGLAGRGLNRTTESVYGDPANGRVVPVEPTIDTSLFPGLSGEDEVQAQISQWIEGRLERGGEAVVSDARIFTLQRYLGQVQEVTP